MDEDQYNQIIKSIACPENCEALITVKTNKLIWDVSSQSTWHTDQNLQNAETFLIYESVLITEVVNKLAEVELEIKDKVGDIGPIIDQCKDAL